MANLNNYDPRDVAPSLNAKLHQVFDPSLEHKEQGHLLGSIQFEKAADSQPPLLLQIIDGFASALQSVFNGASDFFSSNAATGNNSSLAPVSRDVNTGVPLNAYATNDGFLGTFGAEGAGVSEAQINSNSPGNTMAFAAFGGGNDIRTPGPSSSSNGTNGKGTDGRDGTNGENGKDGEDGDDGNDGSNDGPSIPPVIVAPPAHGHENIPVSLDIDVTVDLGSITTIIIGNVPLGATLSAGIYNVLTNSWTLTVAQLNGLTMTPPLYASGHYTLSVTAISSENGLNLSTSTNLQVEVEGVATPPLLSAVNVAAMENTLIPLTINTALVDNDGSETLSIVISGLPAGASLNAGHNNGDGSWTLTPAQLIGLCLVPPANTSGEFNLTVTATSSENGTHASVSELLLVDITGVASTPILNLPSLTGNEDQGILLNIDASLVVNDGSEVLSVIIANVPAGAILSAGHDNGDGSWTLTAQQLIGLTLTPAPNSGADIDLTVTAISTDGSHSAMTSGHLLIGMHGVADTPLLSVQPATGAEGSVIGLAISAALVDTDGSESLTVIISNVPAGSILSAGHNNGNGTWSLTAAQLAGLTIKPPEHFSGVLNLQVTAYAIENDGDSTSITLPCIVTIDPVVSIPDLHVGVSVGNEDQPIALNIQASVADPSETLSIAISGLPAGATLSAGIENNGVWTLTPLQLIGLTITPPHNSDVDFSVMVTVTAMESDGSIFVQSSPLSVIVNAVADTPTVLANNTSGAIDTQVAISISGALTDTDGSETITYVIGGVPDGFALTAGSNNGDNTWTLTPGQLAGLKLISPYHFQGTVHLTAVSVSHEGIGGDVARSLPVPFHVTIGDPLLGITVNLDLGLGLLGIGAGIGIGAQITIGDITNPAGLVILEDTPISLTNLSGLLNLLTPLQQLGLGDILISGLPHDAHLSAGVNLGNGQWSLLSTQLNNLILTVPDSDEDFTLQIDARLLSLVEIGLKTVVVHVIGVADVPSLVVGNAIGHEGDASISVAVTAAITDIDTSETLSIMIKDLPPGVIPNIGINNGDGTWTIPVVQLGSLALLLPEHFSGNATYTIVAVSTEREGDSTTHVVTGRIHVDPVADAPVISCAPNIGLEGQALALNLNIGLQDNDGSEHLAAITISNLPLGVTLSHGTDNHDGTWSINSGDLAQVQIIPPANWHGDGSLTVTATAQEGSNGPTASTATTIAFHVDAVADAPLLSVQDETGMMGDPIDLHISSSLVDLDGSEHLSLVIDGVPPGAMLSAGLNNGDGSWTLSGPQLNSLSLTPPADFNGDIHLSVSAHAHEQSNGHLATTLANLTVHIEAPVSLRSMMGFSNDNAMDNSSNDSWMQNDGGVNDAMPADHSGGSDYDHAFNQQSHTG